MKASKFNKRALCEHEQCYLRDEYAWSDIEGSELGKNWFASGTHGKGALSLGSPSSEISRKPLHKSASRDESE